MLFNCYHVQVQPYSDITYRDVKITRTVLNKQIYTEILLHTGMLESRSQDFTYSEIQ